MLILMMTKRLMLKRKKLIYNELYKQNHGNDIHMPISLTFPPCVFIASLFSLFLHLLRFVICVCHTHFKVVISFLFYSYIQLRSIKITSNSKRLMDFVIDCCDLMGWFMVERISLIVMRCLSSSSFPVLRTNSKKKCTLPDSHVFSPRFLLFFAYRTASFLLLLFYSSESTNQTDFFFFLVLSIVALFHVIM